VNRFTMRRQPKERPRRKQTLQRLRRKILCFLCFLCFSRPAAAQTVPILDTLYNADGSTASGRIVISWEPFTAADMTTVDGGTLTYTIPAAGVNAGVVDIPLYANAGATPAGTSYAARYFLANGAQYTETWIIPASGPATVADVRVLNAPAPGAAIPISALTGGPLPLSLGGTGLDALGAANLCLKVNSAGTALEYGGCAAGGTGITSLNGQTGTSQTFAVGTSGTDFNISSSSDVHTLNLPSASGASRGALASADWTTFNSKQPALSTSGAVANQFVTGFTAPDTFTRAQPSFSNLSGAATAGQVPNLESLNGTLDVPSGGTGAAPGADDQVLVASSTSAAAWKSVPDCNSEQMLTYTAATNTFGCEADDGGGGGMTSFNIDGDNNDPQTITNGNEALFAGGVGIVTTAGATDQVSFAVDFTEIVDNVSLWNGANASRTFTASLSGATDPVLTFANNSLSLNVPLTANLVGNVTGNADTAATANAGDTATAFFSSGTVEAARLPNLDGLNGQISDTQIADGAVDGGSGGEIADGSITSADLAAANKTITCNFVLFASDGLADTDDIASVSNCSYPGRALTITSVRCETDAGSPTVMLQRNDGTAANMLTGNITCTTTRGGAAGTIDTAEDNIAATDTVDFLMVSASTADRVSILVQATVD